MRICICDDDRAIHAQLRNFLQETDPLTEPDITSLYTGEDLIEAYAQDKPFDMIFLDIEMQHANGVQAAQTVRMSDKDVMIVFVSSHRKYVFDAFPVGALHYLLKPVQQAEFTDVYRRAQQRYRDLHAVLHLKYNQDRFTVAVCKILYAEDKLRHVIFHTEDGAIKTVGRLSDYNPTLSVHAFASPHASFLVNMDKIERIEKNEIVLQNGERIFCSVRKRAEMIRAFDNYLGNRKW